MIRMFTIAAMVLALAADTPTVAGTWQLGLQGDHVVPVGMELKQDGAKVTGRILLPTGRGDRVSIDLAGDFVDGALTLASTAEVDVKIHGSQSQKAVLKIIGRMEKDGTMTGTFMDLPWTAERLGPR